MRSCAHWSISLARVVRLAPWPGLRAPSGTGIARNRSASTPMAAKRPRFSSAFRRPGARPESAAATAEPAAAQAPKPAREPDDEHAPSENAEAGWRASSYDLKHGLDVVELPTSLPADVLDRLFNAPRR